VVAVEQDAVFISPWNTNYLSAHMQNRTAASEARVQLSEPMEAAQPSQRRDPFQGAVRLVVVPKPSRDPPPPSVSPGGMPYGCLPLHLPTTAASDLEDAKAALLTELGPGPGGARGQ